MVDSNGSYLTSIRPNDNGIKRRVYLDMSMANIEIDLSRDRVLQWDNGISTDPTDTKYMRKRYLGTKSLYECSHMPTNDFLRHIEGLPSMGKGSRPKIVKYLRPKGRDGEKK